MTEKKAAGAALADAIRIVEEELGKAEAEAGRFDDSDWSAWRRKHRAAMDRLTQRLATLVGAKVDDTWDGARVRISGVMSSSTTGLEGALQNWLRAARKREARP